MNLFMNFAYLNIFRRNRSALSKFIESIIRKDAIKIIIKTVFKAQENQRFSILTLLKFRALKT